MALYSLSRWGLRPRSFTHEPDDLLGEGAEASSSM
jgi:hypothetical protein